MVGPLNQLIEDHSAKIGGNIAHCWVEVPNAVSVEVTECGWCGCCAEHVRPYYDLQLTYYDLHDFTILVKPRAPFTSHQSHVQYAPQLDSIVRGKSEMEETRSLLAEAQAELWRVLADAEYSAIRGATNPFECLGKGPWNNRCIALHYLLAINQWAYLRFMNRSALKLAEMNYVFSLVPEQSTTHFAFLDLCGGPGGFSEYILSTCIQRGVPAIGFGMSLDCPAESSSRTLSCSWNVLRLNQLAPVLFDPIDAPYISSDAESAFYILFGPGKNGDILDRRNRNHLATVVQKHAGGVSLVVADGGFEMGEEEDHEERLFPLLVAQTYCMLSSLRDRGAFVMKLLTSDKVRRIANVRFLFEYDSHVHGLSSL